MTNKNKNTYFSYFFIHYFSIASLFSLFSVYLGDYLHLPNAKVGIIFSIMSITSIFVQPLWGIISDITKKTKLITALALIISIITGLVFLITTSFTAIFINFLIMSLFYTAISPLSDTMAINYINKSRNTTFGTIRSFGSIGYAIGALCIGFITQAYGIHFIFIVFSVFLTFTLLNLFKLDDYPIHTKTSFKEDFKTLLRIPHYWILLFMVFIFIGSLFGPGTYLSLYIKHRYNSLNIIGITFFLMAGIEMPFMILFNRLIKKINPWAIMLLCIILSSIRLYALSLDSTLPIFISICVLQSVILGFSFPTLIHIISSLVPRGVLSTSVTIYTAIGYGLSKFIFGIIAGFLADSYGYAQMFKFFSMLSTIGIILSIYLLTLSKQKSS